MDPEWEARLRRNSVRAAFWVIVLVALLAFVAYFWVMDQAECEPFQRQCVIVVDDIFGGGE